MVRFNSSTWVIALVVLAPSCVRAADEAAETTRVAPSAPAALPTVEVTSARQRLDAARNGLSPETGSSIYRLNAEDFARLPLGESTPLSDTLVRVPGVARSSNGQIYVRGDHANVQYRINGVVLPEAIGGFGPVFETRVARSIDVLTGALPAQYGYRTAGIVNLTTKGAEEGFGGSVGVLGGSFGRAQTDADVHGSADRFNYFLTGSYLRDQRGLENPDAARKPLHDVTHQGKGFGYLSYLVDEDSRVSLMFGGADNRFQIPNRAGVAPQFQFDSQAPRPSGALDARQRERTAYGVAAWQSKLPLGIDYQVALFRRVTDVHYSPDRIGDLIYRGISGDIVRRNAADGVQADASLPLGDAHTLRFGLFNQAERYAVGNRALVFPADASGNQTGTTPLAIDDGSRIRGHLCGLYLQDEWRPIDALTVNYGARYDRVRTVVNEQQWSPRIGLTYDLTSDLRVHAGYARYFTPPPTENIDTTTIARFLGTTNALPSDANTAVKSERSNYWDAGIAAQLTPEITVALDAYYRTVRHLQDEGQFGNALVFSAFNYSRGRIAGAELTGTYRKDRWNAYANLAVSRALGKNIETGQFNFGPDELSYIASNWANLDHDQRYSASSGVSYRFAGDVVASADALYQSGLRRGFANTAHLPGYTVVNLEAHAPFDAWAIGRFEGRVTLLNAFDRKYPIRDGSGIGVGAPQFGIRRAIYAELRKPF